MWFTENPWPGVILLLIPACFFLMRALQGGILRNWILSVCFVLAAGAAYWVEVSIVTPREEVEARLAELLDDCKAGNLEAVLGKVSNNALALKALLASAIALADIHDDVRLSDIHTEMFGENSRAVCHFRANGTVSVKPGHYTGHAATRWELTWQKEGDVWKVNTVRRLHPVSGNELNLTSQAM